MLYWRFSLFAFGFGSLSMLGWLAAAAAPLLIHLWNRRRYRETSWAAIDFLLEALKKNARRLQFEQWLLLALRTLIILLVVIALAEPYWNRQGHPIVAGEPTHRVIVLDGSFSMAYRPTDQSRFERAKELAATIASESRRGDGTSLVLMASPPRVIVASPAFEPRVILEEIEQLRLPHGRADLNATLAKVQEIIERVEKENARLKQHEVYWLTDLQRSTWWADDSDGMRRTIAARARDLCQRAAFTVVDLGQQQCENLAITQVSLDASLATVARDVVIQAQVRNFGQQRRAAQVVEFYVDGHRVGEQMVDIEPAGEGVASLSYRFDSGGDHAIEVRLPGDLLEIDNHRWLSVPVKSSLRVLCVNGRPAAAGLRGATDYLQVALAPSGDLERSLVRPEVVPESALVESDLNSYDCVFLANVGQLTSNEANLLDSYVRHGGALVIFLGDQVVPDSYNRYLGGESPGHRRLLPARLEKPVAEGSYRFDPLDYAHPIVQDFRGREKAGLLTTPVARYIRLRVPEETKARVALAFVNGDPAIVEETIGRGRVMLVATSADTSWTSMPVWASYLPIVHNLLRFGVSGRQADRNVRVGQPIGSLVPVSAADASLILQRPTGERRVVRLESQDGGYAWHYTETDTSGLYVAEAGPPVSRRELYAVNVDTAESDLTKVTAEQLRDDIWPGAAFAHQTTWQDFNEAPTTDVSRRESLHRWLLYGALGLLLLETLLAWRFGSRMA